MTTYVDFANVIDMATAYLSDIDPVMRRAIERIGPCLLKPNPDIFQALVEAILSQQISVKAADAIATRLRAALPGGQFTPETLIALDHDALRALGLSNSKARYIRNLAEHVNSGQLDLDHLSDLDDETIIKELTAVKGIGRWTSEMMLIFALGRSDVLPVDDLGLLEAVRGAYELPARPTQAEMRERGELWRPYRTFATWYMWRYRRLSMGIGPIMSLP